MQYYIKRIFSSFITRVITYFVIGAIIAYTASR